MSKNPEDVIAAGIDLGARRAGKALRNTVVLWGVITFFIFVALLGPVGHLGRDSTDGVRRSGMKLHTDNLSGCQYLSVASGGITPRMSSDGRHHGCRSQRSEVSEVPSLYD